MKVAYLFPEELPMRAARGIQAVQTAWALGKETELVFLPARFEKEAFSFYGLKRLPFTLAPIGRKWGPFKSLWVFLFRAWPWLKKVDLLFTRHLKLAWWLLKLQKWHQRPLIYEAHEIFFEKRPSLKGLEKEVFAKAQALVCVSDGLKQAIEDYFKRAAVVIPNGACLEEVDLKEKFSSPGKNFFYVGSIRYAWKGLETLKEALDLLPPEINLLFVGEGEISHPRLISLGFRSPKGVKELLKKASFAVLPNSGQNRQSRYYTCPMKLLDYMSCGCAIVASDLPSIREIIGPEEALLVPPDDPKALAQAMCFLAEKPKEAYQLAQGAYQRARKFTWENRAQKLLSLFKTL